MNKSLLVFGAVLMACALIVSMSSAIEPASDVLRYGYRVEVMPDQEFDDLVQCSITFYSLHDDNEGRTVGPLRIMVGDSNSLFIHHKDGTEVEFACFIGAQKSEIAYEIRGTRGDELVMSQTGSVRLR